MLLYLWFLHIYEAAHWRWNVLLPQQHNTAQLQGGDSDRQAHPDPDVHPRGDWVPPPPQCESLMIALTNTPHHHHHRQHPFMLGVCSARILTFCWHLRRHFDFFPYTCGSLNPAKLPLPPNGHLMMTTITHHAGLVSSTEAVFSLCITETAGEEAEEKAVVSHASAAQRSLTLTFPSTSLCRTQSMRRASPGTRANRKSSSLFSFMPPISWSSADLCPHVMEL